MSELGPAGQQEGNDASRVVLIADDNQRYRTGIVRAMARRPEIVRVVEATNGAEALDMIREFRPDVALLDVRMPVLDGPSVVQAVRRDPALQGVRVIVMSAADDVTTRDAARDAGAAAFVDKTIPRSRICELVLGTADELGHRPG